MKKLRKKNIIDIIFRQNSNTHKNKGLKNDPNEKVKKEKYN